MDWTKIKGQVSDSLSELFHLFFRSETGRHHGGYPIDKYTTAQNMLVGFKPHVPHIQVTNGLDMIVAEAQNGKITFPVTGERTAQRMNKRFQKLTIASGPQALDQSLKAYRASLKNYERCRKLPDRKRKVVEQMEAVLMLRELKLRALAAQRDLNLYEHGYQPSPLATGEHWNRKHNRDHGLGLGLDLGL